MTVFSRAFLAAIATVFCLSSHAKVDPPNYDFSLDQLKIFMPGQDLQAVIDKRGKGSVLSKEGPFEVRRFYVEHLRYKFPVLTQSAEGKITDFYARLPAYFLHDIFHQSIINRIGQQDVYKKVEEQAVYIWNNKNNLKHIYSGACSITCFPVYYAVYPAKHDLGGTYTPLIKQMANQEVSKY